MMDFDAYENKLRIPSEKFASPWAMSSRSLSMCVYVQVSRHALGVRHAPSSDGGPHKGKGSVCGEAKKKRNGP